MARHSGLLTAAATTADGILDALWGFLDGNTDGGWTWAREGTTTAIYGYKDFGSGGTAVRRVVWICGDAAGSTPGMLSLDAAGADRLFVGAGRIAAGSFAWAGWTNAAPMGSGGVGRTHCLVACAASTSVKVEAFLCDHEVVFRMEGNASVVARIARAGALCTGLSTARGGADNADPDGMRTGAWVSGMTGAVAAGWLSGAEGSNVYATHVGTAGTSHGWVTVSGAVVEAQSRCPNYPNTASAFGGGNIRPRAPTWESFADGTQLGFDDGFVGGQDVSSTTKTLSASGVVIAYFCSRDSSATSTESLVIMAAAQTP
jgi:hypothetical protein